MGNTFIRANGNKLGIGTGNPLGVLSITGGQNSLSSLATYSSIEPLGIFNMFYINSGTYPFYLDIAAIGDTLLTNGGSNIRFLTHCGIANATPVERMRIDNCGRVGIGTTTPLEKFHVHGGNDYNTIFSSDSNRAGWAINTPGTNSGAASGLVLASDGSFRLGNAAHYQIAMYTNHEVGIWGGGTERLLVKSGGDVKIGTDAGANWSYSGLRALQVRNGSYYNYPGYSGWANNMYFTGGGWKYYESYGGGYAEFDLNGGFSIYTTPSGTAGNAATPSQRFVINQTGQVTIGNRVIIETQPSFEAYKTDNEEPSSDTILTYDNATINRGNHYNTSNSRFTAPVAGVYAFGVKVWFKTGSTGTIWVHLRKNGSVFTEQRMSLPNAAADFNTFFPKWIVNLSAGDYIEVSGYGNNSNFHSSNSARYSQFYGHLLH
jgi:hypothetical protein